MDDFDLEQQAIQARRQRAAALRGAQMPDGRMVGNVYVRPSFAQYLATGLKQYAGAKDEQAADDELRGLGEKRRSMERGELEAIAGALRGTPAKPAFDVPANEMGEGFTMNPVQAQPGSAEAMYARALQSPMADFRKMGMQGIGQQAQFAAQQKAAQDEADRKAAAVEAERRRVTGILQQTQGNPQAALAAGVPVEMVKAFYDPGLGKSKLQFVNGTPVDPYTGAPQGQAIPQQAPPVNPRSDLLIPDPKDPSRLIPNDLLIGAKSRVASAGATKVNTNVTLPEKKFYEGLGGAVSDQVAKAHTEAVSASNSLNNANQIAQTMEKAFMGPLANQRLTLARLGSMLGVAGKDDNERLIATRNLMQGLARQELAAAGQMKGQGQITESERAILRKAESGDISELSKPELETFISAIRKTARSRIATHDANMKKLGSDPQAQGLVNFLRIEVPQDVGTSPGQGDFRVIR